MARMVIANAEPASTCVGACRANLVAAAGATTIGEVVELPPLAGSRVAAIVWLPACRNVMTAVAVLGEVPLNDRTTGGSPSGSSLRTVTEPMKFGIGWP